MIIKFFLTIIILFLISLMIPSVYSSGEWDRPYVMNVTNNITNNFYFTYDDTNISQRIDIINLSVEGLYNDTLALNLSVDELNQSIYYLNQTFQYYRRIDVLINASEVNKTSGTWYNGQLLDYIIDNMRSLLESFNNSLSQLINISSYLNESFNILNDSVYNISQDLQDVNDSILYPDGIYLFNDSEYFYVNETSLNFTIKNISKILKYSYNLTVNIVNGSGYNSTNINISYEIMQLRVYPQTLSNKYRIQVSEFPSGNIIDRDRKKHTGVWDILKGYPVNSVIEANITDVDIDEDFIVEIIYLNNGVE